MNIVWGFTSNFDNVYGLFFKITYSNLCFLKKCILTHTTTVIKHNGQSILRRIFMFC